MGHVVKYIMGEKRNHPKYEEWTIEKNSDGKIHLHLKNVRIDMTIKAYNQFHNILKRAYHDIFKP
tara:strand:- start:761 stop:955 length:195 start_codon:yes stop_codon:yes gene_type:complete